MTRAVKNAVTSFQEHNMRPAEIFKMKETLKEAGLKILCSPCDQTTKTPSAGVGIVAQDGISLVSL